MTRNKRFAVTLLLALILAVGISTVANHRHITTPSRLHHSQVQR